MVRGKALQIVNVTDEHTYEFLEDNLSSVLERDDVKDKSVVLLSIAGAYRKGKSFLLNFLLRYLAFVSEHQTSEGWILDDADSLQGFSWRGGSERETTGLLMWSEPFFLKNSCDEEVVVLLMDSQGAFDSQSILKDYTTIFALSMLVSSIQIYNLHANIQEDDFQNLQYFTEYGQLVHREAGSEVEPFQSILFLVRDWSYSYEHPYGLQGGSAFIDKKLQATEMQNEELRGTRESVRNSFSSISCCLMPHPGKTVTTKQEFQGKLSDIEEEFTDCLLELVSHLVSKQQLVVKKMNGVQVTAKDLKLYFKTYIEMFQGDALPELHTVFQSTVKLTNLIASQAAERVYISNMEAKVKSDYQQLNELQEAHRQHRDEAISLFNEYKKMGGEEISSSYRESLKEKIDQTWKRYCLLNDSKRPSRCVLL